MPSYLFLIQFKKISYLSEHYLLSPSLCFCLNSSASGLKLLEIPSGSPTFIKINSAYFRRSDVSLLKQKGRLSATRDTWKVHRVQRPGFKRVLSVFNKQLLLLVIGDCQLQTQGILWED